MHRNAIPVTSTHPSTQFNAIIQTEGLTDAQKNRVQPLNLMYYCWWLLRPAIPCLIFAATFYFTSFRDSRSSKRRRNNIVSIIRKRKLSLIWPTETMVMMLMEEKTPERVPDIHRVYGQQVPVLRLLRLYPGGYKRLYVAGYGF